MTDRLLLLFINWLLVLPFLTFIHELGHGVAGLYLTKGPVTIQIGGVGNNGRRLTFGRLTVILAWRLHLLSPTIGFYHVDQSDLTIRRKVIILLCGPIASFFISMSLGIISLAIRPSPLAFPMYTASILALLQFLLSAIPFTYPSWFGGYRGVPNDGKQIQNYHRLAATLIAQRSNE
jgi:hypothetical protein